MYKLDRAVLLVLTLVTMAQTAQGQAIIFVDFTATGTADGTTWNNAFTDLQSALDAAAGLAGSKTIRVAKGTYKPDTTGLADPRTATFSLQADLEILGGYPGHLAADPDLRDVLANNTTLSGDIGVDNNSTDNIYNVVTADGVPSSAVLDGFRIRSGNANGPLFPNNGGGNILISNGSQAVVRNCIIRLGLSDTGGSGVRITNSSPLFTSCLIADNSSANGGGVYAHRVSAGVCAPRFEQCRFENNIATASDGAAFYSNGGAAPVFVGCVFIDNVAGNRGAGVISYGGQAYFANCSFLNNEATNIGGGGIWAAGANVTVVNSIFSGNTSPGAGGFGGAIYTQDFSGVDADLTVVNSTIAYNSAGIGGGGIYLFHGNLTLLNSILYFNDDHAGTVMDEEAQLATTVPFTVVAHDFNCVQGYTGGFGGANNITTDPQFVDADGADNSIGTTDDDFRLPLASPCIDAADNASVPADAADVDGDANVVEQTPLDRDGDPRFQDQPSVIDTGNGSAPIVDMGALESGTDCDTNGIADADEIAGDPSLDCDINGVLDACETDTDADGVIDACDNCPANANAGQADADADGVGDVCDACNDADGDGWGDGTGGNAGCPNGTDVDCNDAPGNTGDPDADNVCDPADNCPTNSNAAQTDSDADGAGDACDVCQGNDASGDTDGDGLCDDGDGCPADPAKSAPVACGCGVADTDANGNGTPDCLDAAAPPPPAPQTTGGCCAAGSGPFVGFMMPAYLGLVFHRRRKSHRSLRA